MRILFLFLFYVEELLASVAPAWVEGIRSGEERFKLQQGSVTLFRQIGQDCETAKDLVEKDIEREYNGLVNYTTEVIYEDDYGCAVTVSVGSNPKKVSKKAPTSKELMIEMGRQAVAQAYRGLSYKQFNEKVEHNSPLVTDYSISSICKRFFLAYQYSNHGPILVCFKQGVIIGTCVPSLERCFHGKQI